MMGSGAAGHSLDHTAMAGRGRSNLPPGRAGANLPRSRRVFWSVEQAPEMLRDIQTLEAPTNGTIEITLADGTRVRVDNHVDATALRRVLEALRHR